MTKLEWCRANAPTSLQELSDEELVAEMDSVYREYCTVPEPEDTNNMDIDLSFKDYCKMEYSDGFKDVTCNPINVQMDYMVLMLVRLFGDKIAFKGGYMLTKLLPDTARQTTDIDFSIANSELYSDLVRTMRQLAEEFVSVGLIGSYKIKEEVKPHASGGIDMYAPDGRKVLGIDVGWHDIMFGTTSVDIGISNVKAFSVERMLSDKICAIISRKRFRRAKDIYDLYCITNCFDFNTRTVNEYIINSTDGAGAEWRNFPFNETVLIQYKKAYESLSLRSITRGVDLTRPDFAVVINRFSDVCNGCLSEEDLVWNHSTGEMVIARS